MTNSIQFKLLKDDEGYYLGALLTRLMPPKDIVHRKGVMISILKMLAYNQPAAKDLNIPRFKDDRTFKLSTMIKGASSSFSNLLKAFKKFVQSGTGSVAVLNWPKPFNPVLQPVNTLILPSEDQYRKDRRWLTTRVRDFSCAAREFGLSDGGQGISITSADLKSFYNFPLFPITLSNFVTNPTRAVRKLPPIPSALPFDVQKHPAARSHVAQSMLQRLKDDCKIYADEQNLGTVWKMVTLLDEEVERATQQPASPLTTQAISKIEQLVGLLQALKQRDLNYVNVGIQRVLELANEFEQGSLSHVDTLNADGSYSATAVSRLAKGVSALAASMANPSAAPAGPAPAPPPPPPVAANSLPPASARKFLMPDQSDRANWQELQTDDKKAYFYNSVTNVTAWSVQPTNTAQTWRVCQQFLAQSVSCLCLYHFVSLSVCV
jgi:hypothetical protein